MLLPRFLLLISFTQATQLCISISISVFFSFSSSLALWGGFALFYCQKDGGNVWLVFDITHTPCVLAFITVLALATFGSWPVCVSPPTPLPPYSPQAHGSINQRKEDGSTNQRWKRRKKCCSSRDKGKRGKEKNHIHDFSLWDIVSRHARPVPATFLLPPQHPFLACCPLLLGKSPCLDFWSRASHCNAALPHILGLFFRSLCVHVCRSVCMCVGVCGTAPAYFHQWHFAIFQNFRWQLGAKNGSKKTVRHNTKHTRTHTCVLCVCAVGFWFMLPTLPAPCPCHCNGLTGECLFDRRQIETCNKMIKQLLATSRCSPSLAVSLSHQLRPQII